MTSAINTGGKLRLRYPIFLIIIISVFSFYPVDGQESIPLHYNNSGENELAQISNSNNFSGGLSAQISEDAVIITLREQSSVFLDSAFALKIDSALKIIRGKIDTLKNIHTLFDYEVNSLVILTSADWSKKWFEGSLLTGQRYIDSLNTYYNLVKVDTPLFSSSNLFKLTYAQPLRIPVLAGLFKANPDIIIAEPNYRIGDGDDIELVNKDSLWDFAFSRGSGDCPAGCTYRAQTPAAGL